MHSLASLLAFFSQFLAIFLTKKSKNLTAAATALFAIATLTACSEQHGASAPDPKAARPAPVVEVMTITPQEVTIYKDLPAQTYARNKVEVRGRVDGYIDKWLFKPGDMVKQGQPLYVLDRRPFISKLNEAKGKLKDAEANAQFAQQQVSLIEAQANLASANATLVKAKQDHARSRELVAQGAVSRQDFDQAIANYDSAVANVKAREAAVQQAKVSTNTQIDSAQAKVDTQKAEVQSADLNVQYSTIVAPISGLAGESQIPVGGLVSATSTTPLTTIIPLDPLWVRFKVSEAQYLYYKKRNMAPPMLEMFLADGTRFPHLGKVSNALNEVDNRTGTLEVQASFPNPEKTLLPGQFARIKYIHEKRPDAILVPVKAVQQTQNFTSVLVVDAKDEVASHVVKLGDKVNEFFVVESGLAPGERVIVEGMIGARPGIKVQPQPTTLSSLKQPADPLSSVK